MPGIIKAKVTGRVAKDVVIRLRAMSRIFADDGVALFLQQDDIYDSPKIHFEINDLGLINDHHIQDIIEALFIKQKGKGLGDTMATLSFSGREFRLPDDHKKCMNYFS